MELTFYHNYIENTTACGTVLTEHLLKHGRRTQASERTRKSSCNNKKNQKGIRMGPAPQGERAMKE